MLYIKGIDNFSFDRGSVVTLGKFDGVHRGHQLLLETVCEIAGHYGLIAAAFTFTSSPQAAMSHRKNSVIMTNAERKMLMQAFGAEALIECPFTKAVRNMESEDFVRNVILGRMMAKAVVVGDDFRFGKDRAGDPEALERFGKKYGFDVYIMSKIKDGDREISSTYVREELEKGNIAKVNELLGYSYFAAGTVVKGKQLGRTMGFPTANIIPESSKLLPPNGVYSTDTIIGGEAYKSISNIGTRPTVESGPGNIESHLLDFDRDIYGQQIIVRFYEYKRPERKFGSIEELKAQITLDKASR